jgi:hypothetical protein
MFITRIGARSQIRNFHVLVFPGYGAGDPETGIRKMCCMLKYAGAVASIIPVTCHKFVYSPPLPTLDRGPWGPQNT